LRALDEIIPVKSIYHKALKVNSFRAYWKDVGNKILRCATFDLRCALRKDIIEQIHPGNRRKRKWSKL
jgi:hypothetical protein